MKALRYKLETWLVLLGAKAMQSLPLEGAQAFARFCGRAAFGLGVARRAALDNLALAFPEKSPSERRAIAQASYEQFATTMVELTRMPVTNPAEIAAMFEFEGLEIFDQLKAEKRGAVCVSAHYGNWEWMGAAMIQKGYPMTFMIGTQSNPEVDRLFNEYRATVGIRYVRIRALRDVIRLLKNGEFTAALGDQDGDKWGRITRFFGAEVSTHLFWEAPALRTGAAILFGVPERLGPRSHRLAVKRLPDPPEGLNEAQASAFRLQAYNDLLEQAIRKNPPMWLWMHHRFRSIGLHRLEGDERAMAERGEARFDTGIQAWVRASNGERLDFKSWKP
jgi:KDO2-lipid IV(A) lauroyltransferase